MTQEEIYSLIYPDILEDSRQWSQGFSTGRDGTTHELSLATLKNRAKEAVKVFMWPEPDDAEIYHEIAKGIEKARFDIEELILLTMIQALIERYGAAKAVRFMILESL